MLCLFSTRRDAIVFCSAQFHVVTSKTVVVDTRKIKRGRYCKRKESGKQDRVLEEVRRNIHFLEGWRSVTSEVTPHCAGLVDCSLMLPQPRSLINREYTPPIRSPATAGYPLESAGPWSRFGSAAHQGKVWPERSLKVSYYSIHCTAERVAQSVQCTQRRPSEGLEPDTQGYQRNPSEATGYHAGRRMLRCSFRKGQSNQTTDHLGSRSFH